MDLLVQMWAARLSFTFILACFFTITAAQSGSNEVPFIQLAFVSPVTEDFDKIQPNLPTSTETYTINPTQFTAGQVLYIQCRAQYPIEWISNLTVPAEQGILSTSQRYVPNTELINDTESFYFITEIIISEFNQNYSGEYICTQIQSNGGDGSSKEDSSNTCLQESKVNVQLLQEFMVTPAEPIVKLNPKRGTLLACESVHEVTIVHDYNEPPSSPAKQATTAAKNQPLVPASTTLLGVPLFPLTGIPQVPGLPPLALPGAVGLGTGATTPVISVTKSTNTKGDTKYINSAVAFVDSPRIPWTSATIKVSCVKKTDGSILHEWVLKSGETGGKRFGSIRSGKTKKTNNSPPKYVATPNKAQVNISPPRIQLLACEADEEVTLRFTDSELELTSQIIKSTNTTGKTNYTNSAVVVIQTFLLLTNHKYFSTVECVSVKDDKKVLHKWTLTDSKPGSIDKFGYDKGTNAFTCCSNGYLQPELRFIACHSITECKFLAQNSISMQQQKEFPTTATPTSKSDTVCSSVQLSDEATEGMFSCSLGGVEFGENGQIVFYQHTEEGGQGDTMFWDLNSSPPELSGLGALLRLEVTQIHPNALNRIGARRFNSNKKDDGYRYGPGSKIGSSSSTGWKIICQGPKMFYSLGFYLAIENPRSGNLEYLPAVQQMVKGSIYKVSSEIPSSNFKGDTKIQCIAPEWNSYSWGNISITI